MYGFLYARGRGRDGRVGVLRKSVSDFRWSLNYDGKADDLGEAAGNF